MSLGAAGTSACATSSKTVCRIELWRRHSCVCPKGADYQWGKDPLEQLMVRFDSYRAASLGNQASRNLVKVHFRWASNLAGRNACEARAGLESCNVDADPAHKRGRPSRLGRTRRGKIG